MKRVANKVKEKKMKKLLLVVLALTMALGLAAAVSAQESLVVRDESDYIHMTMDELYQEALKEAEAGKTLVAYSNSGSVAKFMEDYPGIMAEGTKIKANAIEEKIPLEYEGSPYVDVIINSDATGNIYLDWYNKGYVFAYFPDAFEGDLLPEYTKFGLPITLEVDVWYYNTTAFPDGCPITSWWDLVEMKEDGTSVYTLVAHPVSNLTFSSMITSLVQHSDLLEEEYRQKYGTDIEYTYPDDFDVEPNNAGYEWLYRFLQTNHIEIDDGDEVIAAVNESTAENPVIGFSSSLKHGDALDLGETVDTVRTMSFNGVGKPKFIYIFSKTDNPAAARLYAMYVLGGEDGKGAGYDAWVKRMGCYPVRKSVDAMEWNQYSFEDIKALPCDLEFVNYNYLDVQDFYNYYAEELK